MIRLECSNTSKSTMEEQKLSSTHSTGLTEKVDVEECKCIHTYHSA